MLDGRAEPAGPDDADLPMPPTAPSRLDNSSFPFPTPGSPDLWRNGAPPLPAAERSREGRGGRPRCPPARAAGEGWRPRGERARGRDGESPGVAETVIDWPPGRSEQQSTARSI